MCCKVPTPVSPLWGTSVFPFERPRPASPQHFPPKPLALPVPWGTAAASPCALRAALPPPQHYPHPPQHYPHLGVTPISALPIQDQCVSSAPLSAPVLASPLVPPPSPESCPMASPSLKATFVFPAQAPSVWHTPGAAEAPLPHRVLHPGSPQLTTASWIWGLEVTCRSKLLISFPQQSNCTAQAQPSLPPCCSQQVPRNCPKPT